MTYEARREYLRKIVVRYRASTRAIKGQILDEFCEVTGYHRKYALRVLNNAPPGDSARRVPRRRATYGPAVVWVLAAIWEAAGYPWSMRLKALLPLWMPWARKRFKLLPGIERQLLAISARQMDRRLKDRKARIKKRLYGRTKPGSLLKHHIPVKTDHWTVSCPGYAEVDLVAHSGSNAAGEFIHSLNLTDIHTTWGESRAVMGKGRDRVRAALEDIEAALPFRLMGIDSDNGTEFINDHLYRYCQSRKIQFTRGRPYKKDDNAHIEQKNWTHVRKLVGYERYDSAAALEAINQLYRNELRLLQNLFLPSVKLLAKKRVGSKLRRRYDRPQTPLERVMVCRQADPVAMAKLKALRDATDPFELSRRIDRQLERIFSLANRARVVSAPQLRQRWRPMSPLRLKCWNRLPAGLA